MLKKKIKLFILVMISFSMLTFFSKAEAFPLFDPGSLASQVGNTVTATTNKITTFNNKIVKGILQAYKSVADFFNNLFTRKENKVPGTKEIKESKVADMSSEESIREAFPELFFRYPSSDPNIQLAYQHEGKEFFEDTMIEAFTAVREMEKQLVALDEEIAKTEEDYSNAEDLNGGLNNVYMISAQTDKVMTIIQELVAIKSQMTAAYAVYGEVDPIYVEQGKGQTSQEKSNDVANK